MGSRIMHLIIANQIAEKISIKDKQEFIVGGIAPDAVSPKELSHFFEGDVEDFSRSIAYEKFYQKYNDKQAYILGYYIHLIADDIWLKGFYLPWLKNRTENGENILKRYHNDFRLLNGKLLEYYKIAPEIVDGIENGLILDLEEVTADDVKGFLPYLKEDMNYKSSDLDKGLDIFTFEQIIGYIETTVEKGCLLLGAAINNGNLSIKNMTVKFAKEILGWKYPMPYDFYNNELTSDSINEMLEESYCAIVDSNDELIGFFCIGKSAQVPTGNQVDAYISRDNVDIGIGMKPVMTGKGNGSKFFSYILKYIGESFPDKDIRLTVATFNERAIHLYNKFGFSEEVKFHTDTAEFITMVKQAK